jgi:hypothetical protein
MANKQQQQQNNNLFLLLGAGIAGIYLIDSLKDAFGIKTEADEIKEIKQNIALDSKYIVKRYVTKTIDGKKVQTGPFMVNLATVAEALYNAMGGNNLLGVGGSFYPTNEPVDLLVGKVATYDMKTIAEIYAMKFKRNLKSDLTFRLWPDGKTKLAAYLNAF